MANNTTYSRISVYFKTGSPVNIECAKQVPSTNTVYRFMSGKIGYEFVKENVNYVRYVL